MRRRGRYLQGGYYFEKITLNMESRPKILASELYLGNPFNNTIISISSLVNTG
jgi:hypothetical protein